MDWCGIPVGNLAEVDNFADGRYEETECVTPDGDGDNADDVNNVGDDSGRCDNSDDWPLVVDNDDDDDDDSKDDDDDVCRDSDNEGGGGDITDDNEENDIDAVTDEDDDETLGVGGA